MLLRRLGVLVFVLSSIAGAAMAQSQLDAALTRKIDIIANTALTSTGVPSASIAIVKDGQIAYVQAYGSARLELRVPALPSMRYSIGSISKQFTAAAILRLAEQKKLSLDDPVSRFLPDLTRAQEVTIRQLLSHTSGYQDYWPQDYVPPFMLQPVTAEKILDLWARKALDFDPGTQWQYSNTNYVIAGLIIEKASGLPLLTYLQRNVFAPLGMQSVLNIDQERLGDTDATGYLRYALGPPRPAPKEGKGWLFAAGELAMTAEDLAKWDVSLIRQSWLQPASYMAMESEVCLKNGLCTNYGLGLFVKREAGHRAVSHGGEVSGFTAQNVVFPDEGIAVAVLTNQDSVDASGLIAHKIAPLLFPQEDATTANQRDRKIFADLQQGKLDRSLLTENANSYFSAQAVRDFSESLRRLGEPTSFQQTSQQERGGMTYRGYIIHFAGSSLQLSVRAMPDGKIEQYQVYAGE